MLVAGVLAVFVIVSCSMVNEYRCARTLELDNRHTASTLADLFASVLPNDQRGLRVIF